jgi:hypothetical protein
MPTTTTTTDQHGTTTQLPSQGQSERWGGIWGAASGLAWPEGNWREAPQYGGNLTAPMSPAMMEYLRQTGGLPAAAPDFGNLMGNANIFAQQASAGIRNPNQININANYIPQDFNVPQFSMQDPFAGYQGGGPGMQVQASQMGTSASDYQTPWERITKPRDVQAERIAAERIAAERISGLPQVTGPNLQQYQMGPAERVQAPYGLSSFDINPAASVQAGTVGTQSFTEPGIAERYMSPYMQNVLDVQKTRAQQDYNQQLTGLRSSAAKAGAFGGSRQAVEEATMNRDLQDRMAQIQATGQQQAFQQAQQQFMGEQGMGLQAGQFNVQQALQAGLSNQQIQQQAELANQQARLATQGLGTQAGLQAALANQQAGLTVGGQNLQALLGTQQLGATLGQQAQTVNQQIAYQQALANQQAMLQAAQANQGTGLQAAMANQQTGLQAGMFNATQDLETQRLNQAAGLQAGMLATQLGFQGAQQQGNWGMQAQQLNQAAQQNQYNRMLQGLQAQYGGNLQAGLQTQGLGMTAQQLANQSRQFGAGLDLQAQNAQEQLRQSQQAQNLPYMNFMAGQNRQIGDWMQQGFGNQMGINTAMQGAAGMQQQYDQDAANRAYQYWQYQQNYPFQQAEWLANIASKFPNEGTVQQDTSGTTKQTTPNPSIFNTIMGGLGTFAGAALGTSGFGGVTGGAPKVTGPAQWVAKGGLISDDGMPYDSPPAGLNYADAYDYAYA